MFKIDNIIQIIHKNVETFYNNQNHTKTCTDMRKTVTTMKIICKCVKTYGNKRKLVK